MAILQKFTVALVRRPIMQ